MPTRVVREGILNSARINSLSFMAELFYRRLMTVADDYGRYYASAVTLRGACFPTCPERVTEKQVQGWLNECLSSDDPLISVYESGGCRYLLINNFGQQIRGKSKFPEPKCLSIANQSIIESKADDSKMPSLVEGEVEGEVVLRRSRSSSAEIEDHFHSKFWPQWVKAKNDSKGAALKAYRTKAKTPELRAEIDQASLKQRAERTEKDPQYRKHAATWLNQDCWRDEPGGDEPLLAGASAELWPGERNGAPHPGLVGGDW